MRWILLVAACGSTTNSGGGILQNRGAVSIDSRSYRYQGQTYGQGIASAAFLREQDDPFFGCQLKRFGECSTHVDCQPIFTATPDLATVGDLGVNLYASAGTINIGGLPKPLMLTLLTMGTFAGQYDVVQQSAPLFQGGEALTISATGAEVPAFSGQVAAPAQPTVTAPAPNARLFRAEDLPVSWTGGGAGQLHVSLSVQQMTGTSGFDCVFAANLGAGLVPSQALELLPPGNAVVTLSLSSESLIAAGVWQVDLAATTGPLAPDGTPLDQLNVILQ